MVLPVTVTPSLKLPLNPSTAEPVVVVTSSDAKRDREEAARLGADRYFQKPLSHDEFMKLGEVVESVLV